MIAGGYQAVTSGQEAGGAQEASHSRSHRRHLPASPQAWTPPVEGCPEDAAKRWEDSPSPMQPRRWVTFEDSS